MEMDELSETIGNFDFGLREGASAGLDPSSPHDQPFSSSSTFASNSIEDISRSRHVRAASIPSAFQQHVHSTIDQQLKCIKSVESFNAHLYSSETDLPRRPTPDHGLSASSPSSNPSPRLATRRVDLTILVSSLPHSAPYPPTPRSTVLPPLSFSSTFTSPAASDSSDNDATGLSPSPSIMSMSMEESFKLDISNKLGLDRIGLGIDNIDLFWDTGSASPLYRDGHSETTAVDLACLSSTEGLPLPSSSREKMTVVLHTGC